MKPGFFSVGSFIAQLPTLVAGRRSLFALFSTYNTVGGHRDGLVETGMADLSVIVSAGGYKMSLASLMAATTAMQAGSRAIAHAIFDASHAQAAEIQQEVGQEAQTVLAEATDDILAIVYAGYSAFNAALEFAQRLHSQHPRAQVYVLTCDCDQTRKQVELRSAIDDGLITGAIETWKCGGVSDMGDLLEALISAWKAR
ncbi:MAG: hypothetical protein V1846_03300 [Candidatus Komeilibacteria bacterium]